MKHKILRKQNSSKMCFVCGVKNDTSLKANFYELASGEVVALFRPLPEHQSYPGRLHGGVAASILDETIGRAINVKDPKIWGVTVDLHVQYKKPVPLDEELKAVGRITRDSSRLFEGTGELLLSNGEVAVTATGKYVKLPVEKIADFGKDPDEWRLWLSENEPEEIEY